MKEMFSKELENLIKVTLADGVLTDKEKSVLIKRAQKEGVDIDELASMKNVAMISVYSDVTKEKGGIGKLITISRK